LFTPRKLSDGSVFKGKSTDSLSEKKKPAWVVPPRNRAKPVFLDLLELTLCFSTRPARTKLFFAGYNAGRIEGNLFSPERSQTVDRPDSVVNETEADTATD